jgi:hypothetical protein
VPHQSAWAWLPGSEGSRPDDALKARSAAPSRHPRRSPHPQPTRHNCRKKSWSIRLTCKFRYPIGYQTLRGSPIFHAKPAARPALRRAGPGAAAPAHAAPRAAGHTLAALQATGLTVVIHDGYLSAQGPADDVKAAAALFASIGDLAVYSGADETGTGTLAVAVAPPDGDDYVELQSADATIASVQNGYSDPFGIYNASGHQVAVVPAQTTENIPPDAAAASSSTPADSGASGAAVGSPGVISGDAIQVPIAIPINLCGNAIDIVGLLNPTFGSTCLNS